MISTTVRGDDLAAAVRASAAIADKAADGAARISAYRTRNDLRKQARRFGSAGRVMNLNKAGKKGGLADSVRVKRQTGFYKVYSKAKYARKRSEVVDLLWVFDNAPTVRASNGKPYIAVPLPDAPIFRNGRRIAWPSEAAAAGWKLDFIPVHGKASVLVLGRRNTFEAWRPLFVLVPEARLRKRFDVDGVFARHTAAIEQLWGEIVDKELIARVVRSAR